MKAPVRVKFCGITRVEDALLAASLGASAIGLVFVEGSPRCVSRERAAEICSVLPPLVGVVGLFMDAPEDRVRSVVARVPLNWLQFHGNETPAYCDAFGMPWIKALPMASPGCVQYHQWSGAQALLLDAHAAGGMGGSGETFDWENAVLPDRPWILAGGLDPDNVGIALSSMAPPAVDVSSGIESAPGIKDAALMRRFMERIQNG
ncbi:MAG: phosphoribosylanthranilate isomerase [Wenzhouxiangellaceae bacterium]|nr:phosphoribosylanthranilate isomerase [Wenzhouxiangellaceae bacterium]MBS3745938.1 phosphoribosylanthranilate isomerase [Wenzhouxiangellaceae bacterium]MBS3823311.1 phosphoribosylanthranilate isomerase [Wenzhouxiangellaceae bacterium]